jgi:hypothetical protein
MLPEICSGSWLRSPTGIFVKFCIAATGTYLEYYLKPFNGMPKKRGKGGVFC